MSVIGLRLALASRVFWWLTLFKVALVVIGRAFAEMVSQPFLIDEAGFSLQAFAVIGAVGSVHSSGVCLFRRPD